MPITWFYSKTLQTYRRSLRSHTKCIPGEFFLEAFARATARPHGYMVIDMKQNTPDILRLRTFIFPGEEQKAYVESWKGCYIPFLSTLASDAEGITWSLSAWKSTAYQINYTFIIGVKFLTTGNVLIHTG